MLKAKFFLFVVLIVSIVGAVFASRQSRTTCLLYSQNAEGLCVVEWPQAVTTMPEGNFIINTFVATHQGSPCTLKDVFECAR
jgi:tRNA A37 threonylcarbamoyladenosine biosynthesis protein TsaE